MARVLFSTYGSAGDLFPLLPLARVLADDGHDVSFAVPRSLGLYLRSTEFPTASVGDGSELRVADDTAIFTTRFSGWASHRRTFVEYLAPRLADDVAAMGRVVERVAPDVVVTMPYAVAARVAALAAGVRHVGCSVYPHFARLASAGPTSFARPFQRQLAAVAPAEVVDRAGTGELAWGVDPDGVLLHDRVLLGPEAPEGAGELVGFPYGDHIPGVPDDLARVTAWLDGSATPAVLVTLGTFIGAFRTDVWDHVAAAVRSCGLRAVVVSARAQMLPPDWSSSDDLLAVGHLPLSAVLDRFVGVVHHGGLGTTFATLRAGRPAVVVPQAFDQAQVAALVERAGVGVVATGETLADGLRAVVDRRELADAARVAGAAMVPADLAVRRAVEVILGADGPSAPTWRAS